MKRTAALCNVQKIRVRPLVVCGDILVLCTLLTLLSPVVLAQPPAAPLRTEDQLIGALLDSQVESQSAASALLDAHPTLVNGRLWDILIFKAGAAYYDTGPKRALFIYEITLEVACRLSDERRLANTYYNLGRTYSGLGRSAQAISAYLASRRHFTAAGRPRDLVYILSDLAALYSYASDYVQARAYAEESLALAERVKREGGPAGMWPDRYGVAGALSVLGDLSLRDGNHGQAIDYIQRAVHIYQELDRGTPLFGFYLAANFAALGRVYRAMGNQVEALVYLDRALKLSQRFLHRNIEAGVLNTLGLLCMDQEDYERATDHFRRSLSLYSGQQNQTEVMRLKKNLGLAYLHRGQYGQALEHLRESFAQAAALPDKEIMMVAGEGMGAVYRERGDYPAALAELGRSERLAEEIGDQKRMAEVLWLKATVHDARRDYAAAAACAERAVQIARRMQVPRLSYLAHLALGRAHLGQGQTEPAWQALSYAVEQVEEMRDRVAGGEYEQQLFFEPRVAAYHAMVDLFAGWRRGAEALLYAERAKGRVLLDALRSGRVDLAQAITPQERAEERELNREIVRHNRQIREELLKPSPDDTRLNELTAGRAEARLKYSSFQHLLHAAHPELLTQRGRLAALTLSDLSELSQDPQVAFLEYTVTRERVYLFVLTARRGEPGFDLRTHVIDLTAEELARKVGGFRRRLADRDLAFSAPSRELYELLLKPAAAEIAGKRALYIIPDGCLWDAPFQAMRSASGRYLIEDFTLSYAPSLSVLQEMRRRKGEGAPPALPLLAFGDPSRGEDGVARRPESGGSEISVPLPEAEFEVRALERIFGPRQSQVFLGPRARESDFKALAPGAGIIHLATHGVLDNLHPLYSYLLLAKGGDEGEDGLLEAREIMNLSLGADLVVLSACETARGRIGAGEGVIGMSWAFSLAGCRTMIVSQWKINSASATQLMTSFYRGLTAGEQDKARALRSAALELMKESRYRHPYYWAGFVLVGSSE